MRIGGLASGIDTDSIIKDMMQAHRIPLNKITQKKQFMEWQLDDYRSVNRDIRSMRDDLFDMTRQSTFMKKTVSVSNENAISVRALNATSEFTGEIEVTQLAKSATYQSKGKTGLNESSKFSQFQELGLLDDNKLQITGPNGEVKEVEIDENDTIKDVVNKINKQTDVNAFFDTHSGKFALTAKESGEGHITVRGLGGGEREAGQNAKFTFNGLETERSSNTFDINGFEITLKETTNSPVTFSSTPDTDAVVDSVKKFVDDYNDLIKELNDKVREQKYRDFHPLSAEEKADMKEKEIEQWEEKAMSGTLRNDPTIQNLLQKMRTTLSGSVTTSTGEKVSLADLGVTPTKDYLSNGRLEINEDKLREAISENPNNVYELFGKTSDDESSETGLITRLRTDLGDANKAITTRAGSVGSGNDSFTLGRSIKQLDKDIVRFETRMETMEERYWKQFAAMENAMQRANSQAEQLMNALGGMGGMM